MNESRPSVTIIGAGIAGMSAALRLLQVGCSVTVIEKTERVGGQFGAVKVGSRYHEHAFHIFADWCQNFFAICKELELNHPPARQGDPTAAFEPRPVFLTLQPLSKDGQQPGNERGPRGRPEADFKRLEYLGRPEYFWKNANAGVAHWSDMVIYQYSVLDMLSDRSLEDDTKEFLNRVSVNGFMNSRPYTSDIAALLHHELLLKVFAVPSYRTSARSYQTYLRHTAAFPPGEPINSDPANLSPSFWAMRGNVHETFWVPLLKTLDRTAKANGVSFKIRYGEEVTGLTLAKSDGGSRVTHIQFGKQKEAVPDQLLVAVPLTGFKSLITNSPELAAVAPELLDVRYLEAVAVPALNLYFNKKLTLPKEHMTLLDSKDDFYAPDPSLARRNGIASRYGLSLVDHSQLWPELSADKTVLSVLAADSPLLMAERDERITRLVLETLRHYISFDPADIDIDKDVHLQAHRDEPLFVNTEGSWEYRPEARLDEGTRTFPRVRDKVVNLALAGDYCRSKVDIVSLEGAIVTGISAARLICDRVPAPKEPPPDSKREAVQRAKAVLDGWIDLATQRSKQNVLSERACVVKKKKATQS